jgi:hypothetical protein
MPCAVFSSSNSKIQFAKTSVVGRMAHITYSGTANSKIRALISCWYTKTAILVINTTGAVGFLYKGSFTPIGSFIVSDGTLYHFAVACTASTFTLYVNGSLIGSANHSFSTAELQICYLGNIGGLAPSTSLAPSPTLAPSGAQDMSCNGRIYKFKLFQSILNKKNIEALASMSDPAPLYDKTDYLADATIDDGIISTDDKKVLLSNWSEINGSENFVENSTGSYAKIKAVASTNGLTTSIAYKALVAAWTALATANATYLGKTNWLMPFVVVDPVSYKKLWQTYRDAENVLSTLIINTVGDAAYAKAIRDAATAAYTPRYRGYGYIASATSPIAYTSEGTVTANVNDWILCTSNSGMGGTIGTIYYWTGSAWAISSEMYRKMAALGDGLTQLTSSAASGFFSNVFAQSIMTNSAAVGTLGAQNIVITATGSIKSQNYIDTAGTAGFFLDAATGKAYFRSAEISGKVNASSGAFSGIITNSGSFLFQNGSGVTTEITKSGINVYGAASAYSSPITGDIKTVIQGRSISIKKYNGSAWIQEYDENASIEGFSITSSSLVSAKKIMSGVNSIVVSATWYDVLVVAGNPYTAGDSGIASICIRDSAGTVVVGAQVKIMCITNGSIQGQIIDLVGHPSYPISNYVKIEAGRLYCRAVGLTTGKICFIRLGYDN